MNILNVLLMSFTLDAGVILEDYSTVIAYPETQVYYAEYSFTLSDAREILYMTCSIENLFAKSKDTAFFDPGMDIYSTEVGIRANGVTVYVFHTCRHLVDNQQYVMKIGWQSLTKVGVRLEI